MRPELIFHTEGFVAGSALAALASHRADVLLRQAPDVAHIRLLDILEQMPNGIRICAARSDGDGPGGETVAVEVAHDPDAAFLRVFARLGRKLAARAAQGAPRRPDGRP